MFRFEKLVVWNLATVYGHGVYNLTESFPKAKLFSLKLKHYLKKPRSVTEILPQEVSHA